MSACGDWLQMLDLRAQRDRPFGVTPSVLIESVLKAASRLQQHLAPAGQTWALFVHHDTWHTGWHMSHCHGDTQLHSRSVGLRAQGKVRLG